MSRWMATAGFVLLGLPAAWIVADAVVGWLQPVPMGLPVWPAFLVLALVMVAWPVANVWSDP